MNQQDKVFLESVVARALYAMTDDVSLFLESKSSLPVLFEALGDDDMKKLGGQVADARKDLKELKKFLGGDEPDSALSKMSGTQKLIKAIEGVLPSERMIAGLSLLGSKKGIAKKVSQAAIAIDAINSARQSIFSATTLLATELGTLSFVKEVMAKSDTDQIKVDFNSLSIKEFMTEHEAAVDMPSIGAIVAGIKRSYKAPAEPPGWLNKAMDVFGLRMPGFKQYPKLKAAQFTKDMLALSFGNVMSLGTKAKKSGAGAAASTEASQDTQYLGGLGRELGTTTTTPTPTTPQTQDLKDDRAGLTSIGTELVDAVGKANAQAFVDVVAGKRKMEDLPQFQRAIVTAALNQFGESSKEEGTEPADAADEVAQAAEEAQDNVLTFPNIEKLAALGKERFGANGDVLITNFFGDDRVKKAFGVNESGMLESLLFEAEEEGGELAQVEFEELFPIAKEVGIDLEPDFDVGEDDLGDFFDAAEEQDLLPASVKKVRKLKSDTVYEYTTTTGKNKGKVRKVKVVGPSEREGYYQAQLQKKDGKFTKDTYALSMSGFGEAIEGGTVSEGLVNRWNVLAGVL